MASSRTSHLFALIALASSVLPLAPLAAGADEAPKRSISLTATGAIRTSPDKVDITTEVIEPGADGEGGARQEQRCHDRGGRGAEVRGARP